MNLLNKQAFIRRKAIENLNDPDGAQIVWSRHAIMAMVQDNLTRVEVENALQDCEVIEDLSTWAPPTPRLLSFGIFTRYSTPTRRHRGW